MTKGLIFVIVSVMIIIFQGHFPLSESIDDGVQIQDKTDKVENGMNTDHIPLDVTVSVSPLEQVVNTQLESSEDVESNGKKTEYSRSDESETLKDAVAASLSSDSPAESTEITSSPPPADTPSLTPAEPSDSQRTVAEAADKPLHTASSDSPSLSSEITPEGVQLHESLSNPDLVPDSSVSTGNEGTEVPKPQQLSSDIDSSSKGEPGVDGTWKPTEKSSQAAAEKSDDVAEAKKEAGSPPTVAVKKADGDEVEEEFPSYSEWKQKELAKQKTKQENTPPAASVIKPKLRVDYASKNCGAKVIATNPEAEHVQGILSSSKDEYMINPCSAKKWFVLELCEPVQVKSVEIASLELFSSQPRSFKVLVSDRNPAKEWREVGSFEATEDKSAQWFAVNDEQFVKFIKVELLDHYGNEHFCPVTLFRVFGIPMDDDDDDNEQTESANVDPVKDALKTEEKEEGKESVKNLFMSAKDTVVKLVKTVLNVDLEPSDREKSESETKDLPADVTGGNYSADGQLLPCDPNLENGKDTEEKKVTNIIVPTVSIPQVSIEKKTKLPEMSTETLTDIQETSVEKQTELPLVTKLADNEQMPSEEKKDSGILVDSLSSCNKKERNSTCPHRLICSYVQTLLGNKITQTCCKEDIKFSSSTDFEMTSVLWYTTSTKTIEAVASDIPEHPVDSPIMNDKDCSSNIVAEQPVSLDKQSTESEVTVDSEVKFKSVEHSSSKSVSQEPINSLNEVKDLPCSENSPADTTSMSTESTLPKQEEIKGKGLNILEPSTSITDAEKPLTSTIPTPELSVADSQVIEQNTKVDVQGSLVSKVSPTPTSVSKDSLEENRYPKTVGASVEGQQSDGSNSAGDQMKEHSAAGQHDATDKDQKASAESVVEEDVVKAQNLTQKKDRVNLKPLELGQISGLPVPKQRETAIMRLTNRIKALELNVSLSSRFLDELSQRFKKQLDDMVKQMTNVSRQSENKDEKQQGQLDVLESRVDNLTKWVIKLSQSFDNLSDKLTDRQMVWASIECIMLAITCVICLRRNKSTLQTSELQHSLLSRQERLGGKTRRNSDIGTMGHTVPFMSIKKQSSETMLATSSHQGNETVQRADPPLGDRTLREGTKKKKRKKHKNLETKSSVDIVKNCNRDSPSSSTQLNRCAGLLFGADAVNALTGVADSVERDSRQCKHGGSTTSLPNHTRQEPEQFSSSIETQPGRTDNSQSDTAVAFPPHKRKMSQPQTTKSVQPVTNGFSETSDSGKRGSSVHFSGPYSRDQIQPVRMVKTETKGYKKWVEWKKSLGFK